MKIRPLMRLSAFSMPWSVVASTCLLAACSNSSPSSFTGAEDAAASCGPRSGSFSVSYSATTAGCPALTDDLATGQSPPALGEGNTTTTTGCKNTGSTSADGCTVDFDTVCSNAEARGSVTWLPDGKSGSGTEQITPAGLPPCTYKMALTKQ